MRYMVPALAALSATVAVPTVSTVQAVELKGGDASIKFGIRLQSRVEIANASAANGDDDYDTWEKETTDEPQTINFLVPRARLYMKGKYKDDWKFELTLSGDKIGKKGASDDGDVDVRYATITRVFKSEGMKHELQFGITKPKFITGHYDSSSRFLMYDARLNTNVKPADRVLGLAYTLKADMFNLYARVSEAGDEDDQNGYLLTLRVESSLIESMKLKKRAESFLGKEGFAHQLGAGIGIATESSAFGGGDNEDASTTFTVDYLLHYNQISALAEFTHRMWSDQETADGDDKFRQAFTIQAGYAIPQDTMIIEPAARIMYYKASGDGSDVYQENGKKSGLYLDGGVNIYLDGHSNKFGFYLTSYLPENGDGDAFIVRAQHQLNF